MLGMDTGGFSPSFALMLDRRDLTEDDVRNSTPFCVFVQLIGLMTVSAEQLPIKSYTTADGLAHNHINRIRQDSRGFMWFCTDEGLSRFDGYSFRNYTTRDGLPHPWVNDLLETHDGVYWVATDGGVSRFNPKGKGMGQEPMFVTYVPGQEADARRVNSLAEDASGIVWLATYNGLYRMERSGGNVKFHFVDVGLTGVGTEIRLVNELALADRGAIWLAARTGLYRLFSDGRAEHYTTSHGLPESFVGTVFQDRSQRWWVSTRNRGFCSLVAEPDVSRPVIERCYSTNDGLPHNDVRAIFQSSDGRMWIGTVGGLSEFVPGAPKGRLFRNYSTANGLSEVQIYQLAEDRAGNLWIGTRRGGVMRMVRNGFIGYAEADGFRSGTSQRAIFETLNRELCVLTSTGPGGFVQRFNGKRFLATVIHFPKTTGADKFYLEGGFQDRAGEWWIATRQGLVRFGRTTRIEDLGRIGPKAIYTKRDGLADNLVGPLYEGARGTIWFSTANLTSREVMLSLWNGPSRRLESHVAKSDSFPSAFGEDGRGGLWIGFYNGDLVRYGSGRFESLAIPPGTTQGAVNALRVDRSGRLWIASTHSGLIRVDDPNSPSPNIAKYTTSQGLSSNEILCLTEDESGRIYAGSNRGVDRLDSKSGLVRRYTMADGLSRGAVGHAYRDHNGVLWFLTDEGISRLIPARDPVPAAPPVHIASLRVRGVQRPISELGETQVEQLELSPDQNQMQIEFVGLDFQPGATLRYQYKLEGEDQDWSAPSSERTVNFARLASGSYRFLVRAVNADGITSPMPASVVFTVLAPIWRRWWFLNLCGLLIFFAVYALYKYRVGQLLAIERIRTRIATDLHDDIGSSLSQITILSEVLRTRLNDADPRQTEPISKIAEISRLLADSMNDIVWAINPARDRLSDLVRRMREFAGDLFIPRDIDLRFEAPAADQDLRLDLEARRQLFLIFKECANNIVRHSGCSEVKFRFAVEAGELVLRADDNGKGFDVRAASNTASGHGLASMRLRAARLGGNVTLESADRHGTTVTISVPLRR
jgi:ligand-binding sensor domain-containing protein/two-component sensor histidine kinase